MKKRLTLNTVAEALRTFPPLSQRCALRARGRPQRGGAALARGRWPGLRQKHAPGAALADTPTARL